MGVNTYSLKKDGNKNITQHFKVREFRCQDGSDKILISYELAQMLEKLRAKLGCTITITSGYRTAAHNKKVGGSSGSKHLKGTAADICCKKDGKIIDAKKVCLAAQDLNIGGIAYICPTAVHIDVRTIRWWADETRNNKKVSDFYPYFGFSYPEPTATVRKGDKGTPVRWVQDKLKKAGYKLSVDGIFGVGTLSAVKKFQKAKKLTIDGLVGPATRKALKK